MNIFRNVNEDIFDYVQRLGNRYSAVVEACDYYLCEASREYQEIAEHDYHLYWEDLKGSDVEMYTITALKLFNLLFTRFEKQLKEHYYDYQMIIDDNQELITNMHKVLVIG